jgi:hypothetical protein
VMMRSWQPLRSFCFTRVSARSTNRCIRPSRPLVSNPEADGVQISLTNDQITRSNYPSRVYHPHTDTRSQSMAPPQVNAVWGRPKKKNGKFTEFR